jgi:pimeloyl-ACP methyl ester carboxylesterase
MLTSEALKAALSSMQQGRVATSDGVELVYQLFGAGPPIVFANGIGVRYPGAVKQIAALRGQYRVLCWDYRGVGQSAMPPHADVTMPRHARDIVAILDALEIDRALFVGWSMGSQVALEVARSFPERIAGYVALLGTCGHPFDNAFPSVMSSFTAGFFKWLHRHHALMQGTFDLAVALPKVTFGLLSRLPFINRQADQEVFAANVRSVAGVDKQIYTRTMLELARHDASDVLPMMSCPALIIAGEHDRLTPPRVAKKMASTIPRAQYREIAGASHFALIEQPEPINRWLREFAAEVYR